MRPCLTSLALPVHGKAANEPAAFMPIVSDWVPKLVAAPFLRLELARAGRQRAKKSGLQQDPSTYL